MKFPYSRESYVLNMNEVENLFDMDLYSYFYGLVRQIPAGMISTYGDLFNFSKYVRVLSNRAVRPYDLVAWCAFGIWVN